MRYTNREKLLRIHDPHVIPKSAQLMKHWYDVQMNDHCFTFHCPEWPEVPAGEPLPRIIATIVDEYEVETDAYHQPDRTMPSVHHPHKCTVCNQRVLLTTQEQQRGICSICVAFDGDSASEEYATL